MYSRLWFYRKSFLLPKRRFKIIAFVPALTCVIVGRGIRGWKLETTVVRISHIEHLQRCFLLLKYKEGYLNFPETVQIINFLGWRTWLRLNVQGSKYPSGSFCLTHCLSRSSPFLFGNLIVSLTFLPQNTVHIVCSLFSHSTPAGCARSMLRVSCIIFIHPAFAVKLHGKILLPIFLCGLVAEVDFDKEEEEISSFLIFFVWGSFVISFFDTFFFSDLYILQCPKGYQ